jgi:hypothetical protein
MLITCKQYVWSIGIFNLQKEELKLLVMYD